MARYLIRRLWSLGATLVTISVVTFVVMQVVPGDPALVILGHEADPGAVEALRAELGLDRPAVVRYLDWASGAVRGDLGTSLRFGRPVSRLILERLPVTVPLTLMAAAFALAVAVPAGVLAATRRNRVTDLLTVSLAQLGLAIPSFWLGILLILGVAVATGWFPPGGFPGWRDGAWPALRALVLPALALGVARAAVLTRMMRASLIEALEEDYVRTARAKGLAERIVTYKHALKNAAIPTVTVLGLQVAGLLAGSIVVERVFALPGVGRLIIYAIGTRDLPLVQGAVLFVAAVVVVTNFLVDLVYAWLDPKVRT